MLQFFSGKKLPISLNLTDEKLFLKMFQQPFAVLHYQLVQEKTHSLSLGYLGSLANAHLIWELSQASETIINNLYRDREVGVIRAKADD